MCVHIFCSLPGGAVCCHCTPPRGYPTGSPSQVSQQDRLGISVTPCLVRMTTGSKVPGESGVFVAWIKDPIRRGAETVHRQFARSPGKVQCRVHSSVVRAADCRSAGPWFKSGCALFSWRQSRARATFWTGSLRLCCYCLRRRHVLRRQRACLNPLLVHVHVLLAIAKEVPQHCHSCVAWMGI